MPQLKLCLIGFGNAGREFSALLLKKQREIKLNTGFDLIVTCICTKSKGNIINTSGINLTEAMDELKTSGRFLTHRIELNTLEAIKASKANILIELSTLSISDGEPAAEHIRTAFKQNMHVITANKGPIAWHYKELYDIAIEKKLNFFYETTVMDGTPVFNLVKYTLPGCKVLGFKGILNSTTNFILEEMEKGMNYEEAIVEAQKRGFAEADPTLDINGSDAAAKTAALANVFMGAQLTPLEVTRTGIENISLLEILKAKEEGKKIKLLCEASIDEASGKTNASVHPAVFPIGHLYSTIDATSSILSITTDLMGEISIVESKPELMQTAYGIYSDLLNMLNLMSCRLI